MNARVHVFLRSLPPLFPEPTQNRLASFVRTIFSPVYLRPVRHRSCVAGVLAPARYRFVLSLGWTRCSQASRNDRLIVPPAALPLLVVAAAGTGSPVAAVSSGLPSTPVTAGGPDSGVGTASRSPFQKQGVGRLQRPPMSWPRRPGPAYGRGGIVAARVQVQTQVGVVRVLCLYG